MRAEVARPKTRGTSTNRPESGQHYDVLVVGSGFGGSVTALRLTEKGYRVGVLEAGRRFADDEFAATSWRIRRFLWAPRLGLYGIQRIHLLPDAVILAGAGVGGGSLVYANTLYVPPQEFFDDPQWSGIADWSGELAPYYDQAARMLGVNDVPHRSPLDDDVRQGGRRHGCRGNVPAHPGRSLLRRPGPDRARPLLRRCGTRPNRLHRMRRMHDRLPAQRQEHPAQELSRPGRGCGRRRTSDDDGLGRPAAFDGWLRRRDRAHRSAEQGTPNIHRRPGGGRGGRLQHPEAVAPDARRRLPARDLVPARAPVPDEFGIVGRCGVPA